MLIFSLHFCTKEIHLCVHSVIVLTLIILEYENVYQVIKSIYVVFSITIDNFLLQMFVTIRVTLYVIIFVTKIYKAFLNVKIALNRTHDAKLKTQMDRVTRIYIIHTLISSAIIVFYDHLFSDSIDSYEH